MQVNSLLGIKTYQKQGFLQDGTRVPLTHVNVVGNVVTQIKTNEKEGYSALQLGIGINKKAKKQKINHAKNAGLETTPRFFKEVRVENADGINLGQEIKAAEIFEAGDIVDVTGISKGKGWAGGVKRYGFRGGPKTHGQSDRHRAPGSIGQGTTPGRVYRGKKMAGRMGQDTVTVKNLEVIEVTKDGALLIKGLVPGSLEALVLVKKMGTNKKFVPLYKEEVAVEEPVAEEAAVVEESAESLPVSDDVQVADDTSSQPISSDAQQESDQTPKTEDVPAPAVEEKVDEEVKEGEVK